MSNGDADTPDVTCDKCDNPTQEGYLVNGQTYHRCEEHNHEYDLSGMCLFHGNECLRCDCGSLMGCACDDLEVSRESTARTVHLNKHKKEEEAS